LTSIPGRTRGAKVRGVAVSRPAFTGFPALVGNAPPADVIAYCGSGVTACHNLLAMETAGITGARLYAGSWSEWCADPARPIERGEGGR
jgi:3-mercaptopyruvate sulfurtransferase SseA